MATPNCVTQTIKLKTMSNLANNPTIDQIFDDWRVLDSAEFAVPPNVRLVSHETLTPTPGITVQCLSPNRLIGLFRKIHFLFCLLYALQLLFSCGKNTVLIVNGSDGLLWLFIGYCRKVPFFKKTKLLLWDVFVEYHLGTEKRLKIFPLIKFKTAWKISVARTALMEYGRIVLWSRKQIAPHAKMFRIPEEKFIFLPYKADHSKWQTYDIPIGNFIFAGGNSKRDYQTLVEAVRGTGIPTIISTTAANVRQQILKPEQIQQKILYNKPANDKNKNHSATENDSCSSVSNIIVLAASEPAFAQLQAASRFIVMPTIYSGLKGTSEANFCNAGWHRKPVIACCSIAAEDYIVEGETGYVVPSGDSGELKKRILELWNNPEKVQTMGKKAREHIEKYFTQIKFIRRLLRLALIFGENE
jgi:glycosyltransferase involved in cell wall biosynthesis